MALIAHSSCLAKKPPSSSPHTSSSLLNQIYLSTEKKQGGGRERASVIRRAPVQKPGFISQRDEVQSKEQSRNESAFLLAWLGLGLVILVEGILLAASGFLPEVWDKFFMKARICGNKFVCDGLALTCQVVRRKDMFGHHQTYTMTKDS
ncbi:hypothetical protein F0562_026506 [Nyssa sinensis]|uniref:Uncharacterized protein n=1 Tax=Nyssa sinensis TaxID=561372 RepID=A0A5J5BAZ2_9ASTE|nr:hypothetical protein F0562_026506 [Nyssa sinensis]